MFVADKNGITTNTCAMELGHTVIANWNARVTVTSFFKDPDNNLGSAVA